MSPTTHLVMKRQVLRCCLAALALISACGSDGAPPGPDAGLCPPPPGTVAPTYTELYTKYFAVGKPGHCATDGCHLDASNGWACGTNKDTCYAGMVDIGIINPADPTRSTLGDPKSSPLSWINPNGNMPQDAVMAFPEGRDAILAWVAACAQNN